MYTTRQLELSRGGPIVPPERLTLLDLAYFAVVAAVLLFAGAVLAISWVHS